MRIVVQRVTNAMCIVDKKIVGKIENGYLLLVGFTYGDNEAILNKAVKKILGLRVFDDQNGKMNLNISQVSGSILSISQFTLYANANEGNRPSFEETLTYNESEKLYDRFNILLKNNNIIVEKGIFGAHMKLTFTNDGPVTINLEFK